MTKKFFVALFLIALLGFGLRLKDYDKVPPPNEDFDEVHYAWGGATWIRDGMPKSWSNYDSYKNLDYIERYGIRWRLAWPIIEKPPLFFWLSGINVLLSRPTDIFSVSHKVIRILPLSLSVFSIILTGLLAARLFEPAIGIAAALLYGLIPTIVLANRMSLTENLLTPLLLSAAYLLTFIGSRFTRKIVYPVSLGLVAFFAVLTKQAGVAVMIPIALVLFLKRQWKSLLIVLCFTFVGFLVYLAIGFYYDFRLLLSLQGDLKVHTLSGLPELIQSIFRYPGISAKNRPFYDGSMLLGFLLLVAAPLWLSRAWANSKEGKFRQLLALIFPFTFLVIIALGESGAGAFNYFGKYIYPLFPFAVIFLAVFLVNLYRKQNMWEMLIAMLILGSSTIRFFFVNAPREFQYLWQNVFVLAFAILFLGWLLGKKSRKFILLTYFVIFLAVNIVIDLRLTDIYVAQVEQVNGVLKLFR